ncbi:hypothetical protein [Pseudophaeobacter sp.]|uniref:hypothetical protein n=1 Tax=Pseudophaeobacter sp. TaxID=1971739 RepID=UPI0040584FF3
MPNPRPTLTITLRRTGGTSLQSFLSQVSPFRSVEHEPFNPDRIWGPIVKAFQESGDEQALEASIDALLKEEVNIKHCIEVIPLDVTRVLIERAKAHNYYFIVLSRKNTTRRLRSLFLAKATGAWSPEQEQERYPAIMSGETQAESLDIQKVRKQVWHDFYVLGQTLAMLRYRKIDYNWVVFEEIYKGELPVSVYAANLAGLIGIDVSNEQDNLRRLNEKGQQSSGGIEAYVPNYDEMMRTLGELCVD